MSSDFQPPPKGLSLLASVGGVVTAIIAIAVLNFWSSSLSQNTQTPAISTSPTLTPTPTSTANLEQQAQKVAKLDADSIVLQETAITPSELSGKTPFITAGVQKLDAVDIAAARLAWSYFQRNWNDQTGLVNSVDGCKHQ